MVRGDKYVLFSILLSGAAVMALELAATRLLTPYFGSTIYVLTSAIAVTLVLLAAGYSYWGRFADKNPNADFMAKLMAAAGVAILVIPLAATPLMRFLEPLGPRWGAFASSLVLLAVPMFCLGGMSPYAVRLLAKNLGNVGSDSGEVFSISTVGSLVGTLAVGFYLIPLIGISSLIHLTAGLLIAAGGGWLLLRGRKIAAALAVIFFLVLFLPEGGSRPEVLYRGDSIYGELAVVGTATETCLLLEGGLQSCVPRGGAQANDYITLVQSVGRSISAKKALMVGLGAGVASSGFSRQGANAVAVEIDPKVVELARQYFGFNGKVVIDDGRRFMRQSSEKYDLIFIDAFSGYSPVEHLHTKEAFQTAKEAMSPEGVLAINTVGWVSGPKAELQRAIYSTLKSVFRNVYVYPMSPDRPNNVVFFASDAELNITSYPLGEGEIITDDKNGIKLYALGAVEDIRNLTLKYYDMYLT